VLGAKLAISEPLMTEVSDQFRLDVPLEDASWACREAVVSLDWPLLESIEPHRLVLKKGVRIVRIPPSPW
jgi:hypothetical protein